MMRSFHRLIAGALLLLSSTSFAAEEPKFAPVKAADLAKSPQRYWATGIAFADTLKGKPGDDSIRIEDEKYFRFKTATIGDCYATKEVVTLLREAKVGKEFVFMGTVLQRGGKYHVLVQAMGITASSIEDLPKSLGDVIRAGSNAVHAATFQRIESLLRGVQTDLIAYAKDKNVEVASLFDPLSEHKDIPYQVMRGGVQSMSDQMKATTTDLFVQFLIAILAQENQIAAAASASAPAPSPAPAAQPDPAPAVSTPAPEPEQAPVEPTPIESTPVEPVIEPEPEPAPVAEAPVADEQVAEPIITEDVIEPQTLDESVIETFTESGAPVLTAPPVIIEEGTEDVSDDTELVLEPMVAPAAVEVTDVAEPEPVPPEVVPSEEPVAPAAEPVPVLEDIPAPGPESVPAEPETEAVPEPVAAEPSEEPADSAPAPAGDEPIDASAPVTLR